MSEHLEYGFPLDADITDPNDTTPRPPRLYHRARSPLGPLGRRREGLSVGRPDLGSRSRTVEAGDPVSTRIRRATRKHRCARCGFEATYENAGAAAARHWFSKHSCLKREMKAVRTALHEQRMALVDRTPKPCLHKVADHQHGTRAAYVLDKCRCEPCAKANADAENWRERQKAYGRYNKYVNAEHVRAHLTELGAYGIGLKRVAKLSGVSTGTLSKIMFGVYAETGTGGGCKGPGVRVREPSRRVLRSTAEKIYDVEAVPANLGSGQADHERTSLARLHLRALVALGWSQAKIARRLGVQPGNFTAMISGDRMLTRGSVDKVEALYRELSMTLPPATNQRERISVNRARNYAKARGWLPPLALPDVDVDETATVELDESAVLRRVAGDRSVRLSREERHEVVRRLHAQGMDDKAIHQRAGIHRDQVARDRRELGLSPNRVEAVVPTHLYDSRARSRRVQQEAS